MTYSIYKKIEGLPSTLDEVITDGDGVYSLRFASEDDFMNTPPLINIVDSAKQVIVVEDWRIVCLDKQYNNENTSQFDDQKFFIMGSRAGKQFISSPLQCVDFSCGFALTQNNLYKLEGDELFSDYLSPECAFGLCLAMWSWGLGRILGIPMPSEELRAKVIASMQEEQQQEPKTI